jgi:hypothetical protein
MQEPSLQAGPSLSERSAPGGFYRASSGGVGAGRVGEDGLTGAGIVDGGDDAQAVTTARVLSSADRRSKGMVRLSQFPH